MDCKEFGCQREEVVGFKVCVFDCQISESVDFIGAEFVAEGAVGGEVLVAEGEDGDVIGVVSRKMSS